MTQLNTTLPNSSVLATGAVNKFAGYVAGLGVAFLLGGAPAANATGSLVSSTQPRVQVNLPSGKRFDSQLLGSLESVADNASDRLIGDLGRIQVGEAGVEVAPASSVILDAERVLTTFVLRDDHLPEVEVEDDGAVALRWILVDGRLLSMEFFGNGNVICTIVDADPAKCSAKKISVGDDLALLRFVEAADVLGELFHQA